MNVKLAWRNIWRNKRRTFITLASIIFAVFLAIITSSMQKGSWDHMINSVLNNYMGPGHVHQAGYWEDQTINNSFEALETENLVADNKYIDDLVPRLESFALASARVQTAGVQVVGIHPEKEDKLTMLSKKLIAGELFNLDDRSAILSEGLARKLGIGIGDSIVLLGQGFRGNSAVGKYPVTGLVKYAASNMNNSMVYLPLPLAQDLYAAPGRLSALILNIPKSYYLEDAIESIQSSLGESYEVMPWQELMPELVQAMKADASGNYIMYFVVYLIIGFGIFSTIIMMTNERKHEFGILLAIGMKRWRLMVMVVLETMLISFLGILSGIAVSVPIIGYMSHNPITLSGGYADAFESYGFEPMYVFSAAAGIFINQAIIIMVIAFFVILYPVIKLGRIDPATAMRS